MTIWQQRSKPTNKTPRRRSALIGLIFMLAVCVGGPIALTHPAAAQATNPQPTTGNQCGSGDKAVKISIDFGCYGEKCQPNCNALVDATFAIIRFLSAGVGIVIVCSCVYAGVQYSSARDDPGAVGKAKSRIAANLFALLLFIFAYAFLNYIIPAGFFLN